jgi:transcriptional regulator with XRE-family HTH domain
MAMPNIQLAKNLRSLRDMNNLTQDDLSDMLNISRQAYSNYENSKRTPDLDSLMRLSAFYHVTLDQLVNGNLSNSSQIFAEEKVPYYMALDIETGNTIYLKKDETELITKFRSLSDDNQKIIIGFLDANSR